jgi:DtxR family Mn-dependent transcriptional regulator
MSETDVTMAERPLVITCQGGSPVSQLAAEIAVGLGSLGVVGPVEDVERISAAGRSGREVIALDGCPSACSSRLAAAEGVRLTATLNLAELGVTADSLGDVDRPALVARAARQLRIGSAAYPLARRHRPGQASALPSGRSHSVGDYLLAIDALASPVVECGALITDAPTLAARVSEALGVSRASAGEMLARIEAGGLVRRGARKELLLTAQGRVAADGIVRRHRLLEVFATSFLGYPLAQSYGRARALEGAFDGETIERLDRSLGYPERCPHGWPVDPLRAREESRELHSLASLAVGEEARVVRLAEHDDASLRRFAELAIVPGSLVTACARTPSGGYRGEADGRDFVLDEQESMAVFVRRLADRAEPGLETPPARSAAAATRRRPDRDP